MSRDVDGNILYNKWLESYMNGQTKTFNQLTSLEKHAGSLLTHSETYLWWVNGEKGLGKCSLHAAALEHKPN